MDGFKAALEVKCICHVPLKTDLKKMDFGTNVKDYKIIAREMMLMTSKINKKYFKESQEKKVVAALLCVTCHRNKPEPKFDLAPIKKE